MHVKIVHACLIGYTIGIEEEKSHAHWQEKQKKEQEKQGLYCPYVPCSVRNAYGRDCLGRYVFGHRVKRHTRTWRQLEFDDEHRSITSDGDTVTLRNVGITNKNHHDQSWYYIDEFKAPEKNWLWTGTGNRNGDPGQMGPVRSDVGRIEIEAKDLSLTSDFGPESENGQWNNKGLFADSPEVFQHPAFST